MQGIEVLSLVRELRPTRCEATEPVHCDNWMRVFQSPRATTAEARALGAVAPQL